jgi:predicted GNAT family acetyltransferase
MADLHPLDRPIWSSLTSGWSHLAQGDGKALRLDHAYGPFGAAANGSSGSLDALAALVPAGGELWIVERGEIAPLPGTALVRTAVLNQMVAERISPQTGEFDWLDLGEADAPEMLALALLTKPGPFAVSTHKLGDFVGIRRDGQLVAMAGERMRMDGLTEVSGVCTHPDHRDCGYAGALMRIVSERILARGETPFLHSYASNAGAIALYESLGFRFRTPINMAVVTRGSGQQ